MAKGTVLLMKNLTERAVKNIVTYSDLSVNRKEKIMSEIIEALKSLSGICFIFLTGMYVYKKICPDNEQADEPINFNRVEYELAEMIAKAKKLRTVENLITDIEICEYESGRYSYIIGLAIPFGALFFSKYVFWLMMKFCQGMTNILKYDLPFFYNPPQQPQNNNQTITLTTDQLRELLKNK